jgi:ABC-type polysaccharide/polyol phosphate export permease
VFALKGILSSSLLQAAGLSNGVKDMVKTLTEAAEIIKYRELLRNLVIRDIKVRYKRSVIGFVWVMLNPLLTMLILYMVFSELFKVSTENYITYLISGIILWNFFSQGTSTSIVSFTSNSNLIKKIYLPRAIFPLSVVISAMIHFLFSLVPLLIIFIITGTSLSSHFYILPAGVIFVVIFSFGISLIVSTLTVFFHDTKYIYEVLLMAWMWMTPIFYPESIVPQKFSVIFHLNPFYYFLNVFRAALYMNVPSLPEDLFYSFLFSVMALIAGWFFYNRYKDRVVYYL